MEWVPTVKTDSGTVRIDSLTVHIDEALLIVVRVKEGMEVTRHFWDHRRWDFKVGRRG